MRMQKRFASHEDDCIEVAAHVFNGGEPYQIVFVFIEIEKGLICNWCKMHATSTAQVAMAENLHVDNRLHRQQGCLFAVE